MRDTLLSLLAVYSRKMPHGAGSRGFIQAGAVFGDEVEEARAAAVRQRALHLGV